MNIVPMLGFRVWSLVTGSVVRRSGRSPVLWVLLVGWVVIAAGGSTVDAADASRLTIQTQAGDRHVFSVEIAATAEEKARGLMFRRHLDVDAGMLFDYGKSQRVSMWMKNTYLPLDMLFIDSSGVIIHIVERTVPMSTEIIDSNGPVRAVLEVNAGTVSRLAIGRGDRVLHPIFRKSQ